MSTALSVDPERVFFPNGTSLAAMNRWLASLQAPKAPKVRLPATPGQTFLPEPDARAREALTGFPCRVTRDRIRVTELMHATTGPCS